MVSRFAGAAWVPLCLGLAGATLINVHQQPQTVFFAEWALALGLLLAFAMTALGRLDGLELRLGLMPWLVGLLAVVCVGRLVSEAPAGLGLGYPLYLGLFGLAYLLGAQLRGQGVVVAAAVGMLVCALLQSLAGLVQLAGWPVGGLVMGKMYLQAFGNIGQANHYANLIFLGLASLAFLHGRRWVGWLFLVPLAAWLALAAAASASRGVWLYTAAFVVLGLVALKRGDDDGRRTGRALLLIALCSVAAQLLVAYGGILAAFDVTTAIDRADDAGSNGQRLYNWQAALLAIQANPWWGSGPGSFYQASIEAMFHTPPAAFPKFAEHAHNLPLQLAAEFGLPLAVLLMLGGLWWYGRHLVASLNPPRLWGLACVAVIGAHSMVEYPLWYVYFMIPLGLAMGVADAQQLALPVLRLPRPLTVTMAVLALGGLVWVAHDWQVLRAAHGLLAGGSPSAPLRERAQAHLARVVPWSALSPHAQVLRVQAWDAADGNAAQMADHCDAFWQRKPSWYMMQRCAEAYGLAGREAALTRIATAFCDGFRFHRDLVLDWGQRHDATAGGLKLAGRACFPEQRAE